MLRRFAKSLVSLAILATLAGPAAAGKLGSEFLVSTKALNSSIAGLPGGAFVVVWRGDGPKYPIVGQRFSKEGVKLGSQIIVSSASHEKAAPKVAMLKAGAGFAVTWDSPDPSGLGVWAQVFSTNGTKVGVRVRANTFKDGDQFGPSVAGLNNSSFVVLWTSNSQGGSPSGIFGQRFNKDGIKQGPEFRADTTLLGAFHQFPSVAPLTSGGFVAVWRGFFGTNGQRFTATAGKVGDEFQVNAANESHLQHPVVAGLTNGGFVVIREVNNADRDVFGQRFNANGGKVGGSFRVNYTQPDHQYQPSVAPLTNNGFVVVWSDGASNHKARGRLYGPSGAAVGGNIKLNSTTVPIDAAPSVGPLPAGGFVAAWQGGSGAGFVIRAQRFNATNP